MEALTEIIYVLAVGGIIIFTHRRARRWYKRSQSESKNTQDSVTPVAAPKPVSKNVQIIRWIVVIALLAWLLSRLLSVLNSDMNEAGFVVIAAAFLIGAPLIFALFALFYATRKQASPKILVFEEIPFKSSLKWILIGFTPVWGIIIFLLYARITGQL